LKRSFLSGLAVAAATAATFCWLPAAQATITAPGAGATGIPAGHAAVAASAGQGPVNPYAPAAGHAYRHGAVPTTRTAARMRTWAAAHPAAQAPAFNVFNLSYGGGVDGIGVTTGPEKVYLVFYGSQWGAAATDINGNTTLAGDTAGEAPYLQQLFKGLGTKSELWSGVMTQYCQGVSAGAQSCSPFAAHVAYPVGKVLAGVWVDESGASPAQASAHQLGTEAVGAATHFGNTTPASNRNAQYVILSPTGTNPDDYQNPITGFCAWHDFNGDSSLDGGGAVPSSVGDIAFTNMPYIVDMGSTCGQDFVNSSGTLDGVSIVEGHEYSETITDQNPAGGWTDSSGEENADKCAWISRGSAGGAFNLSLLTGTFAMQTTWANDGASGQGACEASHAIVHNPVTGPVKSALAGKCLDDFRNGSANTTKVDIFTCNGTAAQNWTVLADSTLRIHGKCLDIIGAKTANGTRIDIWTCVGHWNQVWQHRSNGELFNPHSGKCLEAPSATNTTQLVIWTCNDASNQRWTMP
jgi:serine protease